MAGRGVTGILLGSVVGAPRSLCAQQRQRFRYSADMAHIQGEAAQAKGADGARRAKRWLESTTRVNAQWVNPDKAAINKLTFDWPHGGRTFSYDLGGLMKYGEFDGQMFFAESKNYNAPSDLATHYDKFLAQCYVAFEQREAYCDHFLWIAWSPHSINKWPDLMSKDAVRAAVLKHRKRIFDEEDEEAAAALIVAATVTAVAERLWLIVLSEKQERLVISGEHRGVIDKYEAEKG
jgi:hypothetical protein